MNFDQLYADFSTKVVPLIAQGATITKEYAFDLFGRYTTYLIVVDSFSLLIAVSLLIIGIVLWMNLKKWYDGIDERVRDDDAPHFLVFLIPVTFILFSMLAIPHAIGLLAKDIFVPEVRIFEQINNR